MEDAREARVEALAPAPPRAARSTGGRVTLKVTFSAALVVPGSQAAVTAPAPASLLRTSPGDSAVVVAPVMTPPARVAPVAPCSFTEAGATPATCAMRARKKAPIEGALGAALRGARSRSREEEPTNDTCRLRATGGGRGATPGT